MSSQIEGAGEGADDQPASGIPAETWALLRQAGHVAAARLVELLDGKAWGRLKASDQARLIELALTRAYGPPIKREARLELSGRVSDAVADSLARLSATDLPEHGRTGPERAQECDSASDVHGGGLDPVEARRRRAERRHVRYQI